MLWRRSTPNDDGILTGYGPRYVPSLEAMYADGLRSLEGLPKIDCARTWSHPNYQAAAALLHPIKARRLFPSLVVPRKPKFLNKRYPTFVILIDDREKLPLKFPPLLPSLQADVEPHHERTTTLVIRTKSAHLKTGDYCLQGYESCCIIERKYNLRELQKNLLTTRGFRNFRAECQRLHDECRFPILLFEGALEDLLKPTIHVPEPWKVADALFDLTARYNIQLLGLRSSSVYQRQRTGEAAARLMIRAAFQKEQAHVS